MIPGFLCRFFTKFSCHRCHHHPAKQYILTKSQLFPHLFGIGCAFCYGDVTRFLSHYGPRYAERYTKLFSVVNSQKWVLLVENRNFSTFSTGFSTGVFHSLIPYVYTQCVNIIIATIVMWNINFSNYCHFDDSPFFSLFFYT